MKKSTVDNWDSIEKNWREKLDSHEEVVPGAIWEQMEKKLDEKNKKAYPFIIHLRQWSWAAVLLISFGLTWWQLSNTDTPVVGEKVSSKLTSKIQVPRNELATTGNLEDNIQIVTVENPKHATAISPGEIHSAVSKEIPEEVKSSPFIEENKPNSNPIILADNRSTEKENPALLAKEESVELLIDIQPSQANNQEEVNSYVPEPSKKRNSLFARVVKQLKQAIDGEPVDWQTLKQGDPKLENSIHQVANTYIKTEQVVQRTFQF